METSYTIKYLGNGSVLWLRGKVVASHLYMHLQLGSICIARSHLNSASEKELVNLDILPSMHTI